MIPKMPESFKGSLLKHNPLVINQPRKWTLKEEEWAWSMRKAGGFTVKEIAESIDRDYTQVSIKMKRLAKRYGEYNVKHAAEKYLTNAEFYHHIKPKTILDLYAGKQSYWLVHTEMVYSNDKNVQFTRNNSNLPAMKLIEKLKWEGVKYDLIDVDPFGSGIKEFWAAFGMASKGIILTLGEMGHIRFKRLDWVNKEYGISDLKDFTAENIAKKIMEYENKFLHTKTLKIWKICKWQGIARIYFIKEQHE